MKTLAALLLSSSLLAGCSVGNRLIASPAEYEAFRATRARYTVEDRLAAGATYLERYPEGRFAAEVRAAYERQEQRFYDASSTSIDGLAWYLHVLPNGVHAAEASLRLADLEGERARERDDSTVLLGRATERRLARAARARKALTDFFVGYVGALAAMQSWGRPTWELPLDVLSALRAPPEPGHCDDRSCQRITTMTFQLPIAGGGLEERAAALEIGLLLSNGGVVEASIRGPDLFSRVWEADRGQPIPPDRDEARALAVGHVVDVVGGAFESRLPVARCDKTITPPVILLRECDHLKLEIRIGDTPADDDVIRVRSGG